MKDEKKKKWGKKELNEVRERKKIKKKINNDPKINKRIEEKEKH